MLNKGIITPLFKPVLNSLINISGPLGLLQRSRHIQSFDGEHKTSLYAVNEHADVKKIDPLWLQAGFLLVSTLCWCLLFPIAEVSVIVASLLFHETGHYHAMKHCQLETRGIYLIPFLGGVAVSEVAKTRWQQCYIALMGPFYGFLMALFFFIAWRITGSDYARYFAAFCCWINVFQLIPVVPFDGGQVIKNLVYSATDHPKAPLFLAGVMFLVLLVLDFLFRSGLLVVIISLGIGALLAEWRNPELIRLVPMNRTHALAAALFYSLVLAGLLGLLWLLRHLDTPLLGGM